MPIEEHSTGPSRPARVFAYDEVLEAVMTAYRSTSEILPIPSVDYETKPYSVTGRLMLVGGRAADVLAWVRVMSNVNAITVSPAYTNAAIIQAIGRLGNAPLSVPVSVTTVDHGIGGVAEFRDISVQQLEELAGVSAPAVEAVVA